MSAPILELRGVSKYFASTRGFASRRSAIRAVDTVDLAVAKGEVVGLVGASGCGRSTLGRMAAGIVAPTSGTVLWQGRDRTLMAQADARATKLKVQMIFQNPYVSLNPRLRVEDIVGEAPALTWHDGAAGFAAYLDAQLRRASLDPAYKQRYPHQRWLAAPPGFALSH